MKHRALLCLAITTLLIVNAAPGSSAQTTPPPNDAFAMATEVTDLPATITGTISGATTETGEPAAVNGNPDLSCKDLTSTVWYRVQLSGETPIEVRTSDSISLALYTGTELSRLRQHDCLGPNYMDHFDHDYKRVGFWALPGKTYYLQVGAIGSTSSTEFTLQVERFDEPEAYPKATPPCRSDNYKLFGDRHMVNPKGSVWYLNGRTVPDYLSMSEVKRAIKEALKNIAQSRNDCGLADKVSIRTKFGGPKKAKASTCRVDMMNFFDTGIDKLHVIEFEKDLWASGIACRSHEGSKEDVDIQLRGNKNFFTTDPLTTWCQYGVGGASDLETVLTHELGHAYGLDHPKGGSNLTMQMAGAVCNSTGRTLGLGDVLGLRRMF